MAQRNMTDALNHSGGVLATAREQGRVIGTGEVLAVARRNLRKQVRLITGITGKWAEDGRMEDGSVVAVKAGNSAGAKGPCCFKLFRRDREAVAR
jgi:hypothetical protein